MLNRIIKSIHAAKKHKGFYRYLSNTSWLFAEQMLRMVAGVLVGVWVARFLGPSEFGLLSYAIAFSALFGSIAKLGLDKIVVRELVNDPEKQLIYLGTAFWLKMCGSLLMLGTIYIVLILAAVDQLSKFYIFIIASGTVFQSFDVVDFFFQSKVASRLVSIAKLIQLFISSVLKIYFVLIGADLFWFVVIVLVDQVTLALTLVLVFHKQRIGSFLNHFRLNVAKQFLLDSWPLVFSGLVVMIYMRIDQIMIKEMLGVKELGIFTAAVRLSEVWYFVPMIITQSFFPAILNAYKSSEALYYLRLQRLYTSLVWLAIVFALVISYASEWLVVVLYGEAFKEAAQVLTIHAWTGVFVSLGVASGSWYISENLQRYAFLRTLLGAIVNVLLNFILIPRYGVIGAALATVVAQSMAALFFDALTNKTRRVFFMKLKTLYFANLFTKD